MMTRYTGRMNVPGMLDRPVFVDLDLNGEVLTLTTEGGELGRWEFADLDIRGRDVGFDITIDGAPGHLDTNDDGGFAIELGLHSAPPRLRRLMLAKLAAAPEPHEEPPPPESFGLRHPLRLRRGIR